MMTWIGPQFNGDRTKFKFPYLKNLKRQLRATNTFNIANNAEKIPTQNISSSSSSSPSPSSSNAVPNTYELRIMDKMVDWEKRNQRGFAIITISVTSSILLKINGATTNCKEAYEFLNNQYGGILTVAEVAYLEKELEKRKNADESAEVFIEDWKQLSTQLGITRSAENDSRRRALCIEKTGFVTGSTVYGLRYLIDRGNVPPVAKSLQVVLLCPFSAASSIDLIIESQRVR